MTSLDVLIHLERFKGRYGQDYNQEQNRTDRKLTERLEGRLAIFGLNIERQ